MLDLLRSGRLGLPDDPELVEEFRSVRLVEKSPGNFRIDHHAGKHDDQVISVALAVWQLLKEPVYAPIEMGPDIFGGGLAKWRPTHDGSEAHRRWAVDYYRRTGRKCPECWGAVKQLEQPQAVAFGDFEIETKGVR